MLLACGVRLPDPVLQSVEPDRGWNGEETVISVEGANFYPQVEINANRRDEYDLDRGFSAILRSEVAGEYALGSVSALDYEHLRAVVGPGLPAGIYDLVVVSPTGREAVLPASYTVSNTRADKLDISALDVVAEVNTPEPLAIRLLGPDDEVVQTDLEVEVRVQAVGGGLVDGTFSSPDLENVIIAPNGQSLTGFLGPDGVGDISLSVGTPGRVEVVVAPLDPTSAIRADTLELQWEPGQDLVSIVTLPPTPVPFEVVAGEPFDVEVRVEDQFGNPVEDEDISMLLVSSCGGVFRFLDGPQTTSVTLFDSTVFGNDCSDAPLRFSIIAGPPGESGPITVLPASVSSFGVVTGTTPIRAGDTKSADITPRDPWGNRTAFTGTVVLSDTVGGLQGSDCIPSGFNDVNCRFVSVLAGDAIRLVAESGAIAGESGPYVVRPKLAVDALSVELLDTGVAGEPVHVALSPTDEYGNVLPAADLGSFAISATDDLAEVECAVDTPLPDGRMVQACVLVTARPDATLTFDVDGVQAASAPFEVVNGPLAVATAVTPASVVAGDTFDIAITATDAYGNPYVVQAIDTVQIFDPGGAFVGEVLLDATGQGSQPIRLVSAGSTVLDLVADAVDVGDSSPISVLPDVGVALVVRPLVPWAWTGTATAVRVESVDQFGNRGAESTSVTVSATSGNGADVNAALVNGAATTTFSWTAPALGETLQAVGGGLSGVSAAFDVVSDCGASGPTAVLDFAGAPSGRACWDEVSESASLAGSLAGTVVGASPLARYATSIAGAPAVVSAGPGLTLIVPSLGENPISALVADQAGCGSVASSTIWAGPDDGNPVGEIPLSVDQPVLAVGSNATDIDIVGAFDCTGDPASGGVVRVRSDRGELVGPVPSGTGLEVQLDATGSATFALDAFPASTGGTATLVVESVSGGARATETVEFVGDDRLPWVYQQSPTGDTTGAVDEVVLTFSEPMLAATMVPSAFQIDGPVASSIDEVVMVAPDTWQLLLDAPVSADAGTWTVIATNAVRDAAGNRLDGAANGTASDWIGVFGDLPGAADPLSCTPAVSRFRPDGDPGPGEEADVLHVDLQTASLPAWWVATVEDASSGIVIRRRLVPTGVSDAWEWDGRDVTEAIVPDGTYAVTIRPEDGLGNLGVGCTVPVQIDNALEVP